MTALEIVLILLIILFVGGFVALRVYKAVKRKNAAKNGKSVSAGCGCGCAGCAQSGVCPSAQNSRYAEDDNEQMPEVEVQSNVTCDLKDVAEQIAKK